MEFIKRVLTCLTMAALLVLPLSVAAAAEAGITFSNLAANGIEADFATGKVVLYRDTLSYNLVTVHGKAFSTGARIAKILVSMDNKLTWQEAELNRSGSFDVRFRIASADSYNVYIRATDSNGNSSNAPPLKLIVSNAPMRELVGKRLDAMISAYAAKSTATFMKYVSTDFVNDTTTLSLALQRDFIWLSQIDIKPHILGMASDGKGNIAVTFNFQRSVVATSTGHILRDSGLTEMTFKLTDNGPLLVKMKLPLIFGLSRAGDLQSGVVRATENSQVLTVNATTGNVALQDINHVGDSTVIVYTRFIPYGSWLTFADGSISATSGDYKPTAIADVFRSGIYLYPLYGISSLDQVTTIPLYSSGLYTYTTSNYIPYTPFVAGYDTVTRKYSVGEAIMTSGSGIIVKWKYQSNGTNSF